MAKRVTQQDFDQWKYLRLRAEYEITAIPDPNIYLSPIILKIIRGLQGLRRNPGQEGASEEVSIGVQEINRMKNNLQRALTMLPSGESSTDIIRRIYNVVVSQIIIDNIVENDGQLDTAFRRNFEECIEYLPGDSKSPGGKFVTGIKVTEREIAAWKSYCEAAISDLKKLLEFNLEDARQIFEEALEDLPEFIVQQFEAQVWNNIIQKRGTTESKVNAAIQFLNQLIERLNPNLYPECEDSEAIENELDLKTPKKPEKDNLEEPPKEPKPEKPPEEPTGDCCKDLVNALNRLSGSPNDETFDETLIREVLQRIHETRQELLEARRDGKKNYIWIRDLRQETKEARQDAKKIIEILLDLYPLLIGSEVDISELKEEIRKVKRLVDWNGKMQALGFMGVSSLIVGLGVTLATIASALTAAITAVKAALIGAITAGFSTLTAALNASALKIVVELLQNRVTMLKEFTQIKSLVNPAISGTFTSYDWSEMSEEEKRALDQSPERSLLSDNYFVSNPDKLKGTPTKDSPNKYLKLNEKKITYQGNGILGIAEMIAKQTTILNDIQLDLKQPSSLALAKIKVPIIAWQPVLYSFREDGFRDYSQLKKVLETEFYEPPDYDNSIPYIQLKEISVPVGMESHYYYQYQLAVDDFWWSYQNPPIMLMPEGYEMKPFKYRPQLQLMFVEVREDGSYNRKNSFTLNVQHYDIDRLGKPSKPPVSGYKKGRNVGIMELNDGAKNIIYGHDKEEILKLFREIKELCKPEMVEGIVLDSPDNSSIKWGIRNLGTNGKPIQETTFNLIRCDFFPQGRINRTTRIKPLWKVFFDRSNLEDFKI